MGFLICLGYLAIDFLFEVFNNTVRKWLVIADLAVSVLWSFFSLVAFAVMADKFGGSGSSTAEGAIAFSFFAMLGFGILAGLAIYQYRLGSYQLGPSCDISNSSRGIQETPGTQSRRPPSPTSVTADPADVLY